MSNGGRHGIRDALLARRYWRKRDVRPSRDAWGVSDLWDNHDTHFRRPHETLWGAIVRWARLFFSNALDAYLAYIKAGFILWLVIWYFPKALGEGGGLLLP